MQLEDWREQARRDAARRGLPDLDPLLDMLFRATRALRAADWARAGGAAPQPALRPQAREETAAGAHGPAGDGGEAGGGRAAGPDADPTAGRTGSPPAPPGTTR